MNKNHNAYCRLENFCCNHITDEKTKVKEKSLFLKSEYVYVENFNDIYSLKKRILKFLKIWLIRHPEKEKAWSNQEWKAMMKQELKEEDRDTYPGFMIYNRWQDWNIIGVCYKGWYVLSSNFSCYVRQYAMDLCGISSYVQALEKIPQRDFIFLIPDIKGELEMNLLSEELMDLELKHFLEGMKITEEIEQKVYYPEMVRRGYIDILNEI